MLTNTCTSKFYVGAHIFANTEETGSITPHGLELGEKSPPSFQSVAMREAIFPDGPQHQSSARRDGESFECIDRRVAINSVDMEIHCNSVKHKVDGQLKPVLRRIPKVVVFVGMFYSM